MATLRDKYFEQTTKLFGIERKIKPFPVNFSGRWEKFVLRKKWPLLFTLVSEITQSSFENLIPIWLTLAFIEQDLRIFLGVIAGYLVLEIVNRVGLYVYHLAENTLGASYFTSAYGFFLTVDPIYHTTKSSGKIISKITSSWFDLSSLLNQFVFNIFPAIASFATASVALVTVDSSLLGYTLPAFFLITGVSGYGNYFSTKTFKPKIIKAREEANATSTENLMQNALIRATFSTERQLQKFRTRLLRFFGIRTTGRLAAGLILGLSRVLAILSVTLIGFALFNRVQRGEVSSEVAASLVITYYFGVRSILRIGRTISTTADAYIGVNDMWSYIRRFGKQTYPVLDADTEANFTYQITSSKSA